MKALQTVFAWIRRELLSPFELLYMSIAIATFSHTQYAAAFLFEGKMPVDGDFLWLMKGTLIAISIDLGMLLTSKFLRDAKGKAHIATLILSFLLAAVASFYCQTIYISLFTPRFEMSLGVTPYWQETLQPFIDARVFILPLMLPLLASIYTLARIFDHKAAAVDHEVEALRTVEVPQAQVSEDDEKPAPSQLQAPLPATVSALIDKILSLPATLPPNFDGKIQVDSLAVDVRTLTWVNLITGKTYGPCKNRNMLVISIRGAFRRAKDLSPTQRLLPDPSAPLDAEEV